MSTETILNTDCKNFRSHLPDLLLEKGFAATHPEIMKHSADCASCALELAELQQTFAMLDEFVAPEPSAYFDTRLHARLREVQNAEPEGLWERMRAYLQFSTGRSFRPAVAGALALVLVLGGGGTFLSMHELHPAQPSSTVQDLRVLDNNEQAEQQMGQLLDQSGSEDGDSQPAS